MSTAVGVESLAFLAFAFWGGARLLMGLRPIRAELILWLCSLLALGHGWLVTLFPQALVERFSGGILPLDKDPWIAFGTIDQASSVPAMISASACVMVLWMTLDFGRERLGRLILAGVITASGLTAALAGLCFHQPAQMAELWEIRHVPASAFGLFWYHGNAAAFLNLSWPAGLWLFIKVLRQPYAGIGQQVALSALFVTVLLQITAVFVNLSKVGHVLLLLQLCILAGVCLKYSLQTWDSSALRRALLPTLILAVLLAVGVWLAGGSALLERWEVFAGRRFDDAGRRHAALMALRIGMDYGWWGAGPGTFEWISAHYSTLDPVLQTGRWKHAHNDYAEIFAEWGWLGSILLFLGFLASACPVLITLWRHTFGAAAGQMHFSRGAGLACFSVAAFSTILHACVDFPWQITSCRMLFFMVAGLTIAVSVSTRRSRSE